MSLSTAIFAVIFSAGPDSGFENDYYGSIIKDTGFAENSFFVLLMLFLVMIMAGVVIVLSCKYRMASFCKSSSEEKLNAATTELAKMESEYIRADQDLGRQKELLRVILNNAPVGIWYSEPDEKIRFVNDRFCSILGINREKVLLSGSYDDFLPGAEAEKCRESDRKAYQDGQTYETEESLTTQDGTVNYFNVVKECIHNSEDEHVGIVGIAKDVTEEKLARIQMQRIYKAVDSASDAIGIASADGQHFYQNQAFTEMFGYTFEQLNDRGGPAILFAQKQNYEQVFACIKKGNSWSGEAAMLNSNAERINVFLRADAIKDEQENIIGLIGIHTNITESKQKNEKLLEEKENLNSLFEAAPTAMFLLDENLMVVRANTRAAALFSRTKNKENKLEICDYIACSQSNTNCQDCALSSAMREGLEKWKSFRALDFNVILDSGRQKARYWFLVNIEPVRIDENKMLIVVLHNITESRKKQEQLRELNHALEVRSDALEDARSTAMRLMHQAEQARLDTEKINNELQRSIEQANSLAQKAFIATRAKSQFLANMSHELRTPIHGIVSMLDLAIDENPGSTVEDYLRTAQTSADSLLQLINDILDVSKIESGKLQLNIVEHDLAQTLREVDAMMRYQAQRKGLDFQIIIDPPIASHIQTDPERLRQCLVNLVSNAIKFTEKGHVYLHVSQTTEHNCDFIQFDVEDTGIGIASDKVNSIFESFSQINGSTAKRYGGTGLGLNITRELTSMLGGKITVQSELQSGSTFTIFLPVGRTINAEKEDWLIELNLDSDKSTTESNKSEKLYGKILVAEDHPTNQKAIMKLLEKINLRADLAIDGKQALDMACSNDYDLILMDIQMPVMDGYEATKKIRDYKPSVPIVALTANALVGDAEKCMDAGCNAYIPKPVDRGELYNVLARFLSDKPDQQPPQSSEKKAVEFTGLPGEANTFSDNNEQIVDYQDLLIRICDEQLIAELVPDFFVDSGEHLKQLEQGVNNKNSEAVRKAAHALKGAAETVSAVKVYKIAKYMEDSAKQDKLEDAHQQLQTMRTAYKEFENFVTCQDWQQQARRSVSISTR